MPAKRSFRLIHSTVLARSRTPSPSGAKALWGSRAALIAIALTLAVTLALGGRVPASLASTGNVATGYDALYSNTTGTGNIASGAKALYSNTTGNGNVASGIEALYANTTGNDNIASGFQALHSNTTGDVNIATGGQALSSNTT